MTKAKKSVVVRANNVTVNTSKQQQNSTQSVSGKTQRNRRPRRRNRQQIEQIPVVDEPTLHPVPRGIQTGMSRIVPQEVNSLSQSIRETLEGNACFSEQARMFIERYCDPNGEHCRSLDAARVPDGSLQSSAGGFFRGLTTIVFPWQSNSEVELSGKTYSMLFLQLPLFRSLTFILANETDGEFSVEEMRRFCVALSTLPFPEDILYPNWISLNDPSGVQFATALDSAAMRNVFPPDENGVSGTVDSYRFTSQGLTVLFNTPDLIDQGTYTAMRYPANISTKTPTFVNEVPGAYTVYLRSAWHDTTIIGDNRLQLNDGFLAPGNEFLPRFNDFYSNLPSPNFTATASIRNGSNSWNCSPGQILRYEVSPGSSRVVQLVNTTTAARVDVITHIGDQSNNSSVGSLRLYITSSSDSDVSEAPNTEVTVISLPPVRQDDMLQQQAKTVASLAKDTEGVYIPSCIFEPIFNVTHAVDYRKIVCVVEGVNEKDLLDPWAGWFDTADQNFSVVAVNFQSIPWACKPMVKICRGVEIVPSSDSIIGLFSQGCPPTQAEAVQVCQAFTECQPHGYPANYNGLGLLFGKVLQVCESLPLWIRAGTNLSMAVKKVCEHQLEVDSSDPVESLLATGFKRLMRVK